MSSSNPPVARLRDGALSLAIFQDKAEDGRTRFSSPGVIRSYQDADGNWKDTRSLSGTEFLRAAMMLQDAYRQELDLRAASKSATSGSPEPIPD